tara:strand:+ start:3414 stop:3887 length:474 start_codon:yes stop_codon:yes gene_type:complete
LQFGHHRGTTAFIGVDNNHRTFAAGQPMLNGEINRGHWAMASALQGHTLNVLDVLINDVPTTRLRNEGRVGRQPIGHVLFGRDGVNVFEDGSAKSGAHGPWRSQYVNGGKALHGLEQREMRTPMIRWSWKEQDALQIGQHKRGVVVLSCVKGGRDVL